MSLVKYCSQITHRALLPLKRTAASLVRPKSAGIISAKSLFERSSFTKGAAQVRNYVRKTKGKTNSISTGLQS